MKKVISFLIAIVMMSTTVLADTADGLQKLLTERARLQSFSTKTVLTAKLSKPLAMLEDIPGDTELDIDYSLLINDMIDSESIVECSYNASEDYKKVQMSISVAYDVPLHINDSLKVDAFAKYGFWLNYDVTNAEKPMFTFIRKSPIKTYYEYVDLVEEYGTDVLVDMDAGTMQNVTEGIFTALKDNATITKTSNGYKINLDSKRFNGFIDDYTVMLDEKIADEELKGFLQDVIIPSDFDVLGKDGITLTITQGSNGNITAYAEKIHLDFNLYDLLASMDMSTDGLDRDKSQIDITFEAVSEITGQNKTKVIIPELTDENSRSMSENYYESEYYESEESPIFKNNKIYYPVDEIIRLCKADAKIDGAVLTVADRVYECKEEDIVIENGRTYADAEIFDLMGVYWLFCHYDKDSEAFEFNFQYYWDTRALEYPGTEQIVDELPPVYDDEYEEKPWYVHFYTDREIYMNNGVPYMPVYEFVTELFDGEFYFGYKSLTYTASKSNAYGIESFAVRHGDRHVTVNGENIEIDAPVVEVDGVLNIPISFAKEMGYDGCARTTYYTDGHIESEFELYAEYEYGYAEPFYFEQIHSDQMPYMENGEVYVPLYDLLITMYAGEFTFTDNGMEYTATEENVYEIDKISVTVGDSYITVDNQNISLENKVVSINGIIRVPISFVEEIGLGVNSIHIYNNDSTIYEFYFPNPDCPPEPGYTVEDWMNDNM